MVRLLKVNYKRLSRWWRLAEIFMENKKINLSQNCLGDFEEDKLEILRGLKTLSVEGNKVQFELLNGNAELSFFKNGIIKIFISTRDRKGIDNEQVLKSIDISSLPTAGIEVEQEAEVKKKNLEEKGVNIKYHRYRAHIRFDPFGISLFNNEGKMVCADRKIGHSSDRTVVYKDLREEHFYGGGEQTGSLDKRGKYLEYWNTDVFSVHNDETLHTYCSIPFIIGFINSGNVYGLFIDDGGCSFFNLGRESNQAYYLGAKKDSLSYYIIPGENIKDVVEKYTQMTGRMEIPPLWSLGFHLSKWGYFPYEKVYKIAQLLRRKKIPADAIHLDIDYMEGYRIFTFDRDFFPNPKKMTNKLESMGFKTVAILDPGVKADPDFHVFRDGEGKGFFIKNKDNSTFIGEVWGKESVFPDFMQTKVRNWWAGLVKEFLIKSGISGIWNDMNEPSEFTSIFRTLPDEVMHNIEGKEIPHRAVHNLYGLMEDMATHKGLRDAHHEKRPFVLSRSGFAGVQRYAAVWTGDNRSRFEDLALAIPMNCNLGLSGVAFIGNDVGGFNENCSPELFARWIAMGVFTPFFRVHNICNAKPQEPWAFGQEIEEISREYINLRYRLLPYIYNQFYRAHKTGIPVMAPLIMEYEDDPEVLSLDDEYLFGPDILVAPVFHAGQTGREIYLPEGWWFDYWTEQMLQGGNRIFYEAPLSRLPLFIKADAVLPSWELRQTTTAGPPKELVLDIYPVTGGSQYLYEDDGETTKYKDGQYSLLEIKHGVDQGQYKIELKFIYKNYDSQRERLCFRLHGVRGKSRINIVGELNTEINNLSYDRASKILTFALPDQGRDIELYVKEDEI